MHHASRIMQGIPKRYLPNGSGAQPYACFKSPRPHTFNVGLPWTLHGPRPAGCQTALTTVSGSDTDGAAFRRASANG